MVLYMSCKHVKLRTLLNELALQQLQYKTQVADALFPGKDQISDNIVCTCKLEWWTIVMLLISLS